MREGTAGGERAGHSDASAIDVHAHQSKPCGCLRSKVLRSMPQTKHTLSMLSLTWFCRSRCCANVSMTMPKMMLSSITITMMYRKRSTNQRISAVS